MFLNELKGCAMSKEKGPPDYRNSENGRFVKEQFAKTHPKTTEKEHNRPPKKNGK
jgi:hypothetical protein